ncbi:MAG: N-acetylmuramoyl-L-alanine amidase [Gemmatimonadetes bacterium]|nr:N-acetylmuramoyl-L-alanine amidase [Gemmatimonadota bacterium]
MDGRYKKAVLNKTYVYYLAITMVLIPRKYSSLVLVRTPVWLICLALLWSVSFDPEVLEAAPATPSAPATSSALTALAAPPAPATPKIVDIQNRLPRSFRKRLRKSSRFIVIHSTESGLRSALNTVSRRGYSNYLVARNGTIYRILDKKYRSHHAGLSMWNGLRDISSHSIGIELVGYHNDPFSASQYDALKWLIEVLQRVYKIPDYHVLEHYRVAYGRPNRWVKRLHRGRKKDPGVFNFSRARAGLTSEDPRNSILYDPDVRAGRLIPDPDIDIARVRLVDRGRYDIEVAQLSENVITRRNTAWRIARGHYDEASTVYHFPNGTVMRGNQIRNWDRIPVGTKVYLNRDRTEDVKAVTAVVPVIIQGTTAFDIAGTAYRRSDTYYIFPTGTIKHGRQVRRWDRIPPGTRVLVRYNAPVALNSAGRQAVRRNDTVFLVPRSEVLVAANVPDTSRLAGGTLVFTRK